MENKLAIFSQIEKRLAAVETIDEAKDIRDKAEALRMYAKSAKHGLVIQNRAAFIKILAEQRAGNLLAKVERAEAGRGPKSTNGIRATLAHIQVSEVTGRRWQRMAEVPAEDVKRHEAEFTEKGDELTSAFIYRLANGGAHVAHNAGQSEWYTPLEIIELARAVMGGIDLDPATHADAQAMIQAAEWFTPENDGLAQVWHGRVWMNPPYSQPLVQQFSEKLIGEFQAGNVQAAITLTNNATETEWGQLLLTHAVAVCFPNGRIKFWAPDRESVPLQGQMLCYYGPAPLEFNRAFAHLGICLNKDNPAVASNSADAVATGI